ncbi:hypothetical protein ACP70R_004059 [Stipagrostis hirtigluma subsp. patula]
MLASLRQVHGPAVLLGHGCSSSGAPAAACGKRAVPGDRDGAYRPPPAPAAVRGEAMRRSARRRRGSSGRVHPPRDGRAWAEASFAGRAALLVAPSRRTCK